MVKWGKWVVFGPIISTFEVFSKAVHQVFRKFYRMTGIKKRVNVIVQIFKKWVIIGSKYAKIQNFYIICALKFAEILYDNRHVQGDCRFIVVSLRGDVKVTVVSFFRTAFIIRNFDDCFVFSGSFTDQTGGPFYFLLVYFVKL